MLYVDNIVYIVDKVLFFCAECLYHTFMAVLCTDEVLHYAKFANKN